MAQLNEMSLRARIERDALKSFFESALAVEPRAIGETGEFWARLGGANELEVGFDVYWSDRGYQTFIKWVAKRGLSGSELLRLAERASRHFGTEVAVANFIDSPDVSIDAFLVVRPDGQFHRGYATSNSDVFELSAEGPALPITTVLSALDGA